MVVSDAGSGGDESVPVSPTTTTIRPIITRTPSARLFPSSNDPMEITLYPLVDAYSKFSQYIYEITTFGGLLADNFFICDYDNFKQNYEYLFKWTGFETQLETINLYFKMAEVQKHLLAMFQSFSTELELFERALSEQFLSEIHVIPALGLIEPALPYLKNLSKEIKNILHSNEMLIDCYAQKERIEFILLKLKYYKENDKTPEKIIIYNIEDAAKAANKALNYFDMTRSSRFLALIFDLVIFKIFHFFSSMNSIKFTIFHHFLFYRIRLQQKQLNWEL